MVILLFILAGAFSYDYNGLVTEWKPTQCKLNSCVAGYQSTDFNIHGMWPNNWDGTYPSFCSSVPYAISNATSQLLLTCWVSYNGPPQTFWEHEWTKHGTCVSPTISPDTYFNTTANLYLNKAILKILGVYNVVPSNTQTYTVADVSKAFSRVINLTCSRIGNNYYLNTLMLCYNLNFAWIDCHASTPACGTGFLMPLSSTLEEEFLEEQ